MKISKSRTLRINMGRYESLETRAFVEVDPETDVEFLKAQGVDVNDLVQIETFISEELDRITWEDVQDASEQAVEDSFIHDYQKEMIRRNKP